MPTLNFAPAPGDVVGGVRTRLPSVDDADTVRVSVAELVPGSDESDAPIVCVPAVANVAENVWLPASPAVKL